MRYINGMNIRSLTGYGIVSRHILRALIGPFVFSFATIMFILLLQFVMKFIDQLVGKGLSAWIIIEVIALNLAWIVVLAGPMSVLVATLMAFGELSANNEITTMKATGMSIYRMITPVAGAATILAVLLVLFYNYLLPEANHKARTLASDIRRKKPTLNMQPGIFVKDVSGYSILVRKTFEHSNDLEGITLYDYTNPNINVVITAESGRISFSPDFRKLIFDLHDGEIHELDMQHISSYRRIHFIDHRISMPVEGFDFERSDESVYARGDRELSAETMLAIVDSLQKNRGEIFASVENIVTRDMDRLLTAKTDSAHQYDRLYLPSPVKVPPLVRTRQVSSLITTELSRADFIERQIDGYMVEVYKKFSIPTAAIVFVFLGAPLGIMARRGGFGIGATLSLGFFVMYWAFLIGGEKLADRDILSPFWGMWSANIVLGILGILLMIRIGRETVVLRFDALHRLIPKRFQSKLPEDQPPANTASV
ncbi:MAG TPA: LptF/LptG family permease [Bacteroidota bacterium]